MSTFLELQQELGFQAGLDPTISSQATRLKYWINSAQKRVAKAFEWPFLRSTTPLVLQTVNDITTGTITTVAASTTITFSSGPAASVAGYYIQTSSSNDWYRIATHTAASTSATLEIAAIYSLTAGTYTVRKRFYSTSSTVDRIIQVWQNILPYQLIETSPEYFQSFNPGFLSSGTPRMYMVSGVDSSGYPQFQLWPNPDAVINLYVDYVQIVTDMTSDAQVSIIPAKWHSSVLMEFAKYEAFSGLDDDRKNDCYKIAMAALEEMKVESDIDLKRHRVMTASDNQPVGGNLGYMPLPFNYPRS